MRWPPSTLHLVEDVAALRQISLTTSDEALTLPINNPGPTRTHAYTVI